MVKLISKILDGDMPDREDARRRRMLNVLLVYIGVCALLIASILIVIPTVLINDDEQVARGLFLSVVVAVTVPVLYALNRRISGRLAGLPFVLLLVLIAALSDDPGQIIHRRGLIMFSLPIFLSSVQLRSWASFPIAALSSLALASLSYQAGGFGPVLFIRQRNRRFPARDCHNAAQWRIVGRIRQWDLD